MMKKLILTLGMTMGLALTAAAPAQAQTGHTYLGGATSLAHCQILAGQAGFGVATFGGYLNGIYYWNACFGSAPLGGGGGGGGQVAYYTVYTYSNTSSESCARDIEFEVDGTRCRVVDNLLGKLQCRGRATVGGTLNNIKFVSCVEDAFGPFSNPDL